MYVHTRIRRHEAWHTIFISTARALPHTWSSSPLIMPTHMCVCRDKHSHVHCVKGRRDRAAQPSDIRMKIWLYRQIGEREKNGIRLTGVPRKIVFKTVKFVIKPRSTQWMSPPDYRLSHRRHLCFYLFWRIKGLYFVWPYVHIRLYAMPRPLHPVYFLISFRDFHHVSSFTFIHIFWRAISKEELELVVQRSRDVPPMCMACYILIWEFGRQISRKQQNRKPSTDVFVFSIK